MRSSSFKGSKCTHCRSLIASLFWKWESNKSQPQKDRIGALKCQCFDQYRGRSVKSQFVQFLRCCHSAWSKVRHNKPALRLYTCAIILLIHCVICKPAHEMYSPRESLQIKKEKIPSLTSEACSAVVAVQTAGVFLVEQGRACSDRLKNCVVSPENGWHDTAPRGFCRDGGVLLSPRQVLQAVRAAHVLLYPHVCAVVRVGGVSVGRLLCPGCAEVHPGAERHLAGQQRCSHVGKQALRQYHQPSGEQIRRLRSHRYVYLKLAFTYKKC